MQTKVSQADSHNQIQGHNIRYPLYCGQRCEGGPKIQKLCGRHLWKPPKGMRDAGRQTSIPSASRVMFAPPIKESRIQLWRSLLGQTRTLRDGQRSINDGNRFRNEAPSLPSTEKMKRAFCSVFCCCPTHSGLYHR